MRTVDVTIPAQTLQEPTPAPVLVASFSELINIAAKVNWLTSVQNARELKPWEAEFNFSRPSDPCLFHTQDFCPILNVSAEFSSHENPGDTFFAIKE